MTTIYTATSDTAAAQVIRNRDWNFVTMVSANGSEPTSAGVSTSKSAAIAKADRWISAH